VGKDHPLRLIRMLVNEALAAMAGDFEALYSGLGRNWAFGVIRLKD
jgi:hypothetical protein